MKRMLPLLALGLSSTAALAEDFHVDPTVGNSTFTALFDAAIGERISAASSAVECNASYDEKSGTFSGSCQVPLTTIKVDNEDTKTEHFQQWATNKKSAPKSCKFAAHFSAVKVGQLAAEVPAKFSTEVPFTICGRARGDGGKEQVHGKALLLPAGSYGAAKTIRIRATIEHFDRDKYRIGPKYTDGWLARVQSLAKVVAEQGTVELSLFAKSSSQTSRE